MRLGTQGGTVSLLPVGYQYPALAARGEHDWDANWLVIGGEVRTDDGHTWSFTEPCMTTWEAARLGEWLWEVVSGGIEPVRADGPADDDRVLAFTEPTLAFGLLRRRGEDVVLRVHLSLESPDDEAGDENTRAGRLDHVVPVVVSRADLATAARSWDDELAVFPSR